MITIYIQGLYDKNLGTWRDFVSKIWQMKYLVLIIGLLQLLV